MSIEERIWVAVWYEETKSPVEVQRRYRARFGRNEAAPQRACILRWHEKLFKHGNVLHRESKSGRPRSSGSTSSQATVEEAFNRSPERLSIRRAEMELEIPRSAIHRNLQNAGLKPYKIKVSFKQQQFFLFMPSKYLFLFTGYASIDSRRQRPADSIR